MIVTALATALTTFFANPTAPLEHTSLRVRALRACNLRGGGVGCAAGASLGSPSKRSTLSTRSAHAIAHADFAPRLLG